MRSPERSWKCRIECTGGTSRCTGGLRCVDGRVGGGGGAGVERKGAFRRCYDLFTAGDIYGCKAGVFQCVCILTLCTKFVLFKSSFYTTVTHMVVISVGA